MRTNFHNSGVPYVGIHCVCFSVVTISCLDKIDKKYYPQVKLKCKYVLKGNKMNNFTDLRLELDSPDSDFK